LLPYWMIGGFRSDVDKEVGKKLSRLKEDGSLSDCEEDERIFVSKFISAFYLASATLFLVVFYPVLVVQIVFDEVSK
jgi:hypothetical protein